MISLRVGDVSVQFDRDGSRYFRKSGTMDWVGKPVRIAFGSHYFNFDLEGRVQRIDGLRSPHSWDWLQRSMANDWIYYDKVWVPDSLPLPAGIIGDSVWAVNGRTDLPMLQDHDGLQRGGVERAFESFDTLVDTLRELLAHKAEVFRASGERADAAEEARLWEFLGRAAHYDRAGLQSVADRLHEIHGHMAVLPPDTIDVDYRVILVKVMDGCPNNCEFCMARGDAAYAERNEADIDRQIDALAEVYGADLYNYNSVVLGECDALGSATLEYAAKRSHEVFRCGSSFHAGSNLFLFSTNETLLECSERTFEMLEALPFEQVYINVGWEAVSDTALTRLGKWQTAEQVFLGMEKAGCINRKRGKVKISGNFIIADEFDCDDLMNAMRASRYCGQLYLSPLRDECGSQKALNDLHTIKNARLDIKVALYTMQRM